MVITTKKDKGDTVYYMDGSRPTKGVVEGIEVFYGHAHLLNASRKESGDKPRIAYYMEGHVFPVPEDQIFDSKEALQQSLFNSLD